jgi:polysaccharide deacetylase family protein (PEP-CTERM system associated)
MKAAQKEIVNAFSIDVEDWFQVAAFAPYIDRKDWDSLECRVERNVDLLLQMLDKHCVKATFFTLGWIAERYPALVKRIVAGGHELASHGYGHARVGDLNAEQFSEDIRRSKAILEDISGDLVQGYRAPSFSIGEHTPWAHDSLRRQGYVYSSSVYPIRHDHYGSPDAPRFPYTHVSGMVEVPPTSVRIGSKNLPAAGGGYFRLLPYSLSHWAIQRVNSLEGQPVTFYCHPWEIDPNQPHVNQANIKARFRHYVNQAKMLSKIEALLKHFQWAPMNVAFSDRIRVAA